MKWILISVVPMGFALAGCTPSAVQADYRTSFQLLSENQTYDQTTLTRPSLAAAEGADPDMLNLAVKTLRIDASDRKAVKQPLVINIGGQGGQ